MMPPKLRICDLLKLRKQIVNASSQQLARALLVFIVSEQVEDAIEAFKLFLYSPDLSEHCLNLEQYARVMAQWQIPLLQSSNQLREVVDSPLASNKDLGPTGVVAHEIGLPMTIKSFV
jgi:hypothetical protein